MAFYKQITGFDTYPYQPKQWFNNLEDIILATDYWNRTGAKKTLEFPPLGAIREENGFLGGTVYRNVRVAGRARFMWVWNNSGSDLTQGQFVVRRANQVITNVDSGGTNYATKASTFTANKEIGGLVYVHDDAGGAGASPEGYFAQIWKNDANTLYFQPDLPVSLAANDDLTIIYNAHVATGASGAVMANFRGIVISPDGLPDGYMGWVCIEADAVGASVVAAGTAITGGKGLIGANSGLLTNGSSSNPELILAYALVGVASDTVNRQALVCLRSNPALMASA